MTFAGGRLALAFTRGLKTSNIPCRVIGVDGDTISMHRSKADVNVRVPRASDPAYVGMLNSVIDEYQVDLVTVQLEAELLPISANRDLIKADVFLPKHRTVEIGDSKWATYDIWRREGIATPESVLIDDHSDLQNAFDHFGGKMWLRALTGAGGKGSMRVTAIEDARKWLDLWEGKAEFMAAQLMKDDAWSWESVWDHGRLVVAQARKRLRWEFKNLTMSGVTGIAGASETVSNPDVERTCIEAVLAVDPEPHGIMGLDISFDNAGTPYVTEINPGRFMSGGSLLFAGHGLNLAEAAIRVAFGEWPSNSKLDDYRLPDGMICISGIDVDPLVSSRNKFDDIDREFARRLDHHSA